MPHMGSNKVRHLRSRISIDEHYRRLRSLSLTPPAVKHGAAPPGLYAEMTASRYVLSAMIF